MSRLLVVAPAVLLAGIVAVGATLLAKGGDPQHVSPDALVGKPLPSTALRDLSGAPGKLSTSVRGPALVNVFASWCEPCKIEHPLLLKLKADGVPIVGVAYKDKLKDTKDFLAESGDPFAKVLSDPDGRAGIDLGITGVPETFLVDGRGVVVMKRGMPIDKVDADALEAKWRELAHPAGPNAR